jgi:hypothetical protein
MIQFLCERLIFETTKSDAGALSAQMKKITVLMMA